MKAAERERDELFAASIPSDFSPYADAERRAAAAEAQRDELVEALADLLDNGMPYKARLVLAKVRGEAE